MFYKRVRLPNGFVCDSIHIFFFDKVVDASERTNERMNVR